MFNDLTSHPEYILAPSTKTSTLYCMFQYVKRQKVIQHPLIKF